MNKKDTSGAAFPAFESHYGQMLAVGGMTLRDYFAAKAMQSYVQQELIRCKAGQSVDESLAQMAYEVADAMLAARSEA